MFLIVLNDRKVKTQRLVRAEFLAAGGCFLSLSSPGEKAGSKLLGSSWKDTNPIIKTPAS